MATETHATTEAAGHAAGGAGLPQLDLALWPGQIVWFLIFFTIAFVLMAKVFVPRVGGTIDEREGRISDDIARARTLKEQAEAQAAAADAETVQARAQAQKVAAEAKGRVQAEAAARQAVEEARLAETLAAAEESIRAARDQAMGQVQAIAAETAQAIVAKLSGRAATAAEVQSALPKSA